MVLNILETIILFYLEKCHFPFNTTKLIYLEGKLKVSLNGRYKVNFLILKAKSKRAVLSVHLPILNHDISCQPVGVE